MKVRIQNFQSIADSSRRGAINIKRDDLEKVND